MSSAQTSSTWRSNQSRRSGIERRPPVEARCAIRHHLAIAQRTDVATRLTSALRVPARTRLLAALGEGPLTAAQLGERLGLDRAELDRQLTALEDLELIVRDGGRYALSYVGPVEDDEWEALPVSVRRKQAAHTVTHVHAAAAAAADAGGFDRRDMQLARLTLALDEEGWRRAARIVRGAFEELSRLPQLPPEEAEVTAAAVLMLFTDPLGAREEGANGAQRPFSEQEGYERGAQIAAAIQDELTSDSTSWLGIVALADQLRVLARAASLARPLHEDP
ncbi:MAG: helix-turn-helix domain-containing protein [Actinomycetota bacterium]|nr:helix-turn-helix domain-containing protein [Actinomycetota bacterium]